MMSRTNSARLTAGIAGLAALAGLAVAGGAMSAAAASSTEPSEGPDMPISGAALERASAAAVGHLGRGTVTGTEVGDEESYYEVEVTLPDGSETDVQLDREFTVVGDEPDGAASD